MTELALYKFIKDNGVEWHREEHDGTSDVIIMPYLFTIEDFYKVIQGYKEGEGGLEIRLLDGYFAVWMNDLCEYFGIEMNNVFIGEGD